jgi:hypothetical protein
MTAGLPAAETLVEIDHLRALLEPDEDAEIRGLAAAERDRLLDVIGDAGALLRRVKRDPYRERLLAEDRLIGAGHRHEILKVHGIGLPGRAAFANDNDVEDHAHRVAGVFAFEVSLAQQPVECDVIGAPLLSRTENGGVGKRPQDDRARAGLRGRFWRRWRNPAATGKREEADQQRTRCGARTSHRLECVPSQNGLPPVDLQPQTRTSSVAAAVIGPVSPTSLCACSQEAILSS